jgi:bifunctional non-homologous end joining protein LigD
MTLARYHQKRDFRVTPEPRGKVARGAHAELSFVVQKHAASHLHYDFRLELGGVLLSWAVPKGPSVDPADRRLAIHVEDHPLEYGGFEGTIPARQYGAGTVMVWDRGLWMPQGDPAEGYAKGHLKFTLEGVKLKGGWTLVRSQGGRFGGKYGGKRAGDMWFLIKERDRFAQAGRSIVDDAPDSVVSGRSLDDIAHGAARVWQSNRSVAQNVRAGALVPLAPAALAPAHAAKAASRAPKLARRAARDSAAASRGAADDPDAEAGAAARLPPQARRARLPAKLAPMLATLVQGPPAGEGWVHEIKYDGYRMLARVDNGRARLYSRNGNDWTAALQAIAADLATLPLASGWLDGEIAVADAQGRTSFQRLQNALAGDTGSITYFVFDLPFANGYDLREVPLDKRKAMLRTLLDPPPARLRFGVEIVAEGAAVFAQARALGLEGIVSKRLASHYVGARSRDWLKIKCGRRQEMVIVGYTDPGGSREGFGALVLGAHDAAGALRYAGRVGTGFDTATLRTLAARLRPLGVDKPAVIGAPRGAASRDVHWVKPVLVAEIAFAEWTNDGTLRQPSFVGLRADKKASEVVREREVPVRDAGAAPPAGAGKPARRAGVRQAATAKRSATRPVKIARRASAGDGAPARDNARTVARKRADPPAAVSDSRDTIEGVRITHPDKLMYADVELSKLDVARHYALVAARLLPHLAGRPLSLLRCPDGWQGECFYQKHAPDSLGGAVGRVRVQESAGPANYAEVHSAAGLVALAQWGVLEIHPWGSRAPRLERPDLLVFDFDPDDAVSWQDLVDAVKAMRKLLAEIGLTPFLKTTGGKGLHVVTPLRPSADWTVAKDFARAVAELMANTFPDRFVATMAKARRKERIFIDWLRNAEGATAIAPYALRARAGAPVATPLEWRELDAGVDLRRDHFNARNIAARLALRDPWRGLAASAPALTASMRKRVGA